MAQAFTMAKPELLAQNPNVEAIEIWPINNYSQLNKSMMQNKSANEMAVALEMNVPFVKEECGDTMWDEVLAQVELTKTETEQIIEFIVKKR